MDALDEIMKTQRSISVILEADDKNNVINFPTTSVNFTPIDGENSRYQNNYRSTDLDRRDRPYNNTAAAQRENSNYEILMRLLDEDGFECYPLSGKSFDGGFVVKDRTLKKDRHGQPYQACASVKYERPSDQDFRDRDRTKNIGILISVNFNFDNTVKIPKPFLIRDEDLEEVARTISRSIRDSDVLYGEQSKKGNIVTDALQIVLDQVQGARVISSFLKGHMFNASISKDDIRVNIELQYFRGRDLVFIDAAFIDVSDYGKKRKFYYNAITNGRDTSSQEISKIIIDLLTIDPDAAKAAAIAMAKKSQGFSVV